MKYIGVSIIAITIAQGRQYIMEPREPITKKNCASKIFKINGKESSITLVSDENLFKILPRGFTSKNEIFA